MFSRADLMKRGLPMVLVIICSALVVTSPADGYPRGGLDLGGRWSFNRIEKCLTRKLNNARARHGLRALNPDKQLGYVARRHARAMAATGGIYHDGDMGNEITRWRRLGQNTGRAGGCKRAFRAFMRSSAHRGNILGRWRFVGVGAERRNGQLYVQQVFESRRDPGNVYRYP
ncbi:MAG: CAP domain-containing protein [Actinomycetota bacterium]|nr:CAP domain-containing protein [Actinomycetota bacterium]